MDERDIQVFIDGTIHYFNQSSDARATVGTPYLLEHGDKVASDLTGIIGISGERKGCVYFTAPSNLLENLLESLGEPDPNDDLLADMVGEVANTISGNARRYFGKEFMISVPIVVKGTPEKIHVPKSLRAVNIPISWKQHNANLVVSLE